MTEIWQDCQIHPEDECFETYDADTHKLVHRDCEVNA
jgi:hypothetical protein